MARRPSFHGGRRAQQLAFDGVKQRWGGAGDVGEDDRDVAAVEVEARAGAERASMPPVVIPGRVGGPGIHTR